MARIIQTAGWGVVIAAGLLLAACGGSGSDGPPPPPPPQENRAPVITVSSTASVDEDSAGAVITSVQTSDADGDTLTVTVDDQRFELSGGNLKLKADRSLDYEAETSVTVTITASDGQDSVTATVTVSVNPLRPDVRFTDATAATGITVTRDYQAAPDGSQSGRDGEVREFGGGVAAGDYDNDGWVDLFIVRGDIGPNLLYRNMGDNTFRDMAHEAGVAFTKSATENYKHKRTWFRRHGRRWLHRSVYRGH